MAIRDSQDLELVITSPTTQNIRVSQDLELVITAPTSSKIRVSQDVVLVLVSNAVTGGHLTADIQDVGSRRIRSDLGPFHCT